MKYYVQVSNLFSKPVKSNITYCQDRLILAIVVRQVNIQDQSVLVAEACAKSA